jgi:hypothetical protein
MALILHTQSEEIKIPDSYLLVSLDETGHEQPDDRAHPAFGLGGCAVTVGRYEAWLKTPWLELKAKYFGGSELPMRVRNEGQVFTFALCYLLEKDTAIGKDPTAAIPALADPFCQVKNTSAACS